MLLIVSVGIEDISLVTNRLINVWFHPAGDCEKIVFGLITIAYKDLDAYSNTLIYCIMDIQARCTPL